MYRVAIIQSNYIPWKGYFDLINLSDEFIIYDQVQFTKNDWRNRNRIKTNHGTTWLTIPVRHSGRFGQRIDETEVGDGGRWAGKHLKSILQYYHKAPYLHEIKSSLSEIYNDCKNEFFLSSINRKFIIYINSLLNIETKITDAKDYNVRGDKTERLVQLCSFVSGDEYISGPAAKSYLDETLFERAGIKVRYMDYSEYPEYPQLYCPPFIHEVSVLDLILTAGKKNAKKYIHNSKNGNSL